MRLLDSPAGLQRRRPLMGHRKLACPVSPVTVPRNVVRYTGDRTLTLERYPSSVRRPSVLLALVLGACAPVIVVGLLAMHATPSVSVDHVVAMPMNGAGAHAVTVAARSVVKPGTAPSSHWTAHELATCVWILVGVVALGLAVSRAPFRTRALPVLARRFGSVRSARAPPIATRLSLVGLLRR